MSTITGVYLGTASTSPAERRRALRRFACLFAAAGMRGKKTGGVVFFRRDGTCEIERTTSTPAMFTIGRRLRELLDSNDDTTVAVLGYAGPTPGEGSPGTVDNQPVKTGTTVGVHDDGITNGGTLAADLGFSPRGKGDNRVLIHLVHMALARPGGNCTAAEISTRLRLIDGAFALAAWDGRFPESLLVAKYRRELFVFRDEPHGPVYLSSRQRLFQDLFGAAAAKSSAPDNGVWVYNPGDLTPQTVKIFPETAGQVKTRGRTYADERRGEVRNDL